MARSQVAWGLDIGTTSLKAIKLARAGGKVTIEAFDVIEHESFLSEADVDEGTVVRGTLAKFMERNTPRKEPMFVGVPGSQTFARFVKLPPVDPKKIPEIVKFEAIQQIPFPLDQVNWDYQTFQSPESPDVEVGIFAMKKELVAHVLSHFQESNLAVAGVQMSPLAVFNAVEYDALTDGKGTVVLDIGAKDTNLIFVDHGRLWLRTINIGGNNFTDALSKSFRLSFSKAEELKKTAATSKYARQVYQSMRPVFADLVAEIQRSIGFYNSSHRDSRLERVIGMGNPFKLPNLQKYLAQNLSMEVIRLETFKNAAAENKLAAGLNENILGLSSAYGLALQGLDLVEIDTNLLPMEIARQMLWKEKRPWFIAAAALVAIGVGVAGIKTTSIDAPAFAETQTSTEHQQNETKIAELKAFKDNFLKIHDTYKDDREQVLSFVNLSSDRAIWPRIWVDIFEALPQNNPANAKGLKSANRHEHKAIYIQAISADYSTSLDPGVAPAGGTPSTRGFTVNISGYTPFSVPDRKASRDLIREYLQTIADKAPAPLATRPFYYYKRSSPPPYEEHAIGGPIMGGAPIPPGGDMIWGGQRGGPFAGMFDSQIMGIVPATQPSGTTPGQLPILEVPQSGGASDKPAIPIEPGTGESMLGDDVFTAQFTIYISPIAPSK